MTTAMRVQDDTERLLDGSLSRPYYGANQVFRLLLGRRIASMILADPSILNAARSEIARMRGLPHKGDTFLLWEGVLGMPPERIAERLAEEGPESDHLRETMPCFVGLDEPSMMDLVMRSIRLFRAQTA